MVSALWIRYSKIAVTLHVSPVPIFVHDYFVLMVCFVSGWWGEGGEEVHHQNYIPRVAFSEIGPCFYKRFQMSHLLL